MQKFLRLFLLTCGITAAPASWAWVNPIAISSTQTLAFGMFAAGSGGSVTVSAGGLRNAGGGVLLVPSGGGSAGSFSVTGDPSLTYAITLPANGVVVLTSGANTMAVDNFTSNPVLTGQLSIGGAQTLTVGATLSVGSNQPSGSYSGSYAVTVNYN